MAKDLRQFLQAAREAGPDFYVEVKKPLKPELEVCIIQQKLADQGRFPVIYCPEIEGSKLPLVTDLFGSYEMFKLMLDIDPKVTDKNRIRQEFAKRQGNLRPTQMVSTSEAPVKEVILRDKEVDLGLLPIIKHALLSSGKYITIGFTISKDPDTGIPNAGVYRHELKGKDLLGCWINPGNNGAYIMRRCGELGKLMEVVLVIGHHPLAVMGSLTPGALDVNELEVMGGLLEEPLQVVQAETVDLPVPAYAEIAIEGTIDPQNFGSDGPFPEYLGYYGTAKSGICPLINVTAITMRKDAIYLDLDPSHREHYMSLELVEETVVYDAVRRIVPSIKAVCFSPSSHLQHMYVSIKKRIPGEARLAALAALSAEPLHKVCVVVDEDVDVYNEEEVLWAIATRVVGDKDIIFIPGVPATTLDPYAYDETRLKRGNMNTYIIVDATKPLDLPFALTRITPSPDLWESMNLDDYLG